MRLSDRMSVGPSVRVHLCKSDTDFSSTRKAQVHICLSALESRALLKAVALLDGEERWRKAIQKDKR